MSDSLKNWLGIAALGAIIILSLSTGYYVYYYSRSIQPSSYRSYSVSAEGKIVAKPDVALFTFSVITEGAKDVAKIQTDNVQKTNEIIGFIKQSGVDEKDITTQRYDVMPRYIYYPCVDRGPCSPATIDGYTMTQSVAVKIRNFDKISDILSTVVSRGASDVSQLQFTIDDPSELQNQARAIAITKAQQKAKDIARAGSFGVGRLLSISENSPYEPPFYAYGVGGAKDMAASTPAPLPSIEPGSKDITVTVTLTYEIE